MPLISSFDLAISEVEYKTCANIFNSVTFLRENLFKKRRKKNIRIDPKLI